MRNHQDDDFAVDLRLSRDICVESDESGFEPLRERAQSANTVPRFVDLPAAVTLFLEFKWTTVRDDSQTA